MKQAIKKYKLDLKYLIIDATEFKMYKSEESDLVRFGYSHEKKDIPQVNLLLCVNSQQIPFLARVFSGNTSDVVMFDEFLEFLRLKYRFISEKVDKIYAIFDQGNVSEATLPYLYEYMSKGIYFVAMYRTAGMMKFVKKVEKNELELIYEKERSKNRVTNIYGKTLTANIYGKKCSVLVCYNPDIAKAKKQIIRNRLNTVKQCLKKLNQLNLTVPQKEAELQKVISENL